MTKLMNAPVAAPRVIVSNDEIISVTMITRNRETGMFTFMNVGNQAQGMEALEIATPTIKIESKPVETIAPEQTSLVPPRRRGRPRKNAEVVAAPVTTTPAVTTPAAVVTPVETTMPKKRGRPRKNPVDATTPVASTPAPAATSSPKKGFGKPMKKEHFLLADTIGRGIILTKKNIEMEVVVVSADDDGSRIRVCNPDKDQSMCKAGFVYGATWMIDEDRLVKML